MKLDLADNFSITLGKLTATSNEEDDILLLPSRVILVGRGHTGNLAPIMEGMGINVVDLSRDSFYLDEDTAIETKADLIRILGNYQDELRSTMVILQVYDDATIYGTSPMGAKILPYQEGDKWRVEGAL